MDFIKVFKGLSILVKCFMMFSALIIFLTTVQKCDCREMNDCNIFMDIFCQLVGQVKTRILHFLPDSRLTIYKNFLLKNMALA